MRYTNTPPWTSPQAVQASLSCNNRHAPWAYAVGSASSNTGSSAGHSACLSGDDDDELMLNVLRCHLTY